MRYLQPTIINEENQINFLNYRSEFTSIYKEEFKIKFQNDK